ncbi:MAG TPA: histidinol dehydrogenase [Dehalococcoidia bacterium]|nr:histidinol dehydrogenase [Dehalococcoidia bacterium]
MRMIKGFAQAKAALSRPTPAEAYPVSPALQKRLKEIFGTDDAEQAVRQIIGEVRERGDVALFDLAFRIDGVKLTSLEIGREKIARAYQEVDEALLSALELAAEQISSFHHAQRDNIWHEVTQASVGQLIRPLERVGIYVPGGTASYPSTVLMTMVPAKVAGVKEVVLATPPRQDGSVLPATLVAADMAQVDRIFCVGGAQAIAALAYGTQSIPRVDKVCGPGNIFVVLAKKLVYGDVAIDGLQGPSEVLIIADETASPQYCAADLLAQAEHDPLASAILLTTSPSFADEVNREVERQLEGLSRREVIAQSLTNRGMIAVVESLDAALELANLYAPEHLLLMVKDAAAYLDRVSNAGCVLLGHGATVVLGDYVAGPSHVLPTGGTARFGSALNITDFIKFINTIAVDEASLEKLGKAASIMARAEGFDAHARAVERRLKRD